MADVEREGLKACPVSWCDNSRPMLAQRGGHLYRVRCNECQTETPLYHTEGEAEDAWNTRPDLPGRSAGEEARLLREPTTAAPAGCYCSAICMAPRVMGRQQPCRRAGGIPGKPAPQAPAPVDPSEGVGARVVQLADPASYRATDLSGRHTALSIPGASVGQGLGSGWLTITADRALYLDQGKDAILCDRLPSPVTLVLKNPVRQCGGFLPSDRRDEFPIALAGREDTSAIVDSSMYAAEAGESPGASADADRAGGADAPQPVPVSAKGAHPSREGTAG
jgi:hypothetical protein